MSVLLDTHAFLWYFEDSDKLSENAVKVIEDANVQKFISIVSLWEFSIKYGLNKLKFDGGLSLLWEMITQNGFIILPIKQNYLERIVQLPFIHRDPFDRLLVATAKSEELVILTADENIHKYDVSFAW